MRVTSKGQVTIPKQIRERLGLLPGTEVEFIEEGGEARIRRLPGGRTRGDEIVDRLLKASGGDIPLSTDEIMRMTRGENWGRGA
jgi:AbrB family looped-hinge helix DNA binding protein